jgi:hypothetical protein
VQYEIDLNKKNARAFRKKLTPFVEHARKAGPGQRRGPGRTASSRQRSAEIRAWAKARGLAVSDRGRIPASVAGQYEATTTRPLRMPGHHRHEPIRSDGPWPRPASQRRAGGPFRRCRLWPHGARVKPGSMRRPRAKTFARTIDATWGWRRRLRLHPARAGARQRAITVDGNTRRDRECRARTRAEPPLCAILKQDYARL